MDRASDVPLFNGLKHVPCPKEAGGATCSTPQCLFGHRCDGQPSNKRPAARSHALDGALDGHASEDPGPLNKRQRSNPTSHAQQLLTDNNDIPTFAGKVKDSDLYDPLSPATLGDRANELPGAVTSTPSRPCSTPNTPRASHLHSLPPAKPATPPRLVDSPISTPAFASSPLSASNKKRTDKSTSPSAVAKPTAALSLAPALAHSSSVRKIASPQVKDQCVTRNKAALSKYQRKAETLNPRHVTSAPEKHGTRHQLLNKLHIELVRLNGQLSVESEKEPDLKPLIKSDQELIWMALDIEEKLAIDKGPIYRNKMSHTVVAHRRMDVLTYAAGIKKQFAPQPVLRGGSGSDKDAPNKAASPVVIDTGLIASQEVELLHRLITPITNLEPHGYISTPPTEEQIAQTAEAVGWSKNWENCDRCTTRFQVFPEGNVDTGEVTGGGTCLHHPGKTYFPARPAGHTGFINKKYKCCNEELSESQGCATADCHVWKTSDPKRLAILWNWVETPANDSSDVSKAVAFDCEMGYTVRGMELLRLTATSWPDGQELIDVLVQPFGRILDLNSRWSGVFMQDLLNGVPWTKDWKLPPQKPGQRKTLRKVGSPKAARDLLFSVIGPETVLIGHGLENDLNAMRMIHPKIVDTILLYPHNKGLPVRNSLKMLVERHLRRQIQNDTGSGHDSAEDARAAGDLVRLQVQKKWETMSAKGWRFSDGALRPPGRTATTTAAVDMRSSDKT